MSAAKQCRRLMLRGRVLNQTKMKKVIITGYTAKNEGLILETNVDAKLKTGNVKGKTIFVSWDKIGKLLFDNYTEDVEVFERNKLRGL